MKKQLIIMGVAALTLFAGCGLFKSKKSEVDFNSFISKVAKASYSDYSGKEGVKVKDEASFNEMKSYILKRYSDVHVKQSFAGTDGQVVDCIPLNEQPAIKLGVLKDLQINQHSPSFTRAGQVLRDTSGKTLVNDFKAIDITLKESEKDKYGNQMFCPAGYIPVKRITLEILTRYTTLNSFLGKTGIRFKRSGDVPAPYGDGYDHNHVVGQQAVDNAGGDSWLNVWSPSVSPGIFSLSQQWFTGGSGDNLQTIEGGWQVEPDRYSTSNACLFIYSTNANYSSGSGGYNLDNGTFVQVSNQVYLGAPFDHYSATDGGQWGFNLQWKRNTDGNWWLFYKGPGDYIAVGYYPKSFYGSGQMASFSQESDYGAEVAGSPKEGQMGSGAKAADGWQKAAFQNRIFYIIKDNIDQSAWSNLTLFEENSSCYTGTLHNIYGDWGTYLYFGGSSCNN